ncbi:hypothetical protein H0X09_03800 [Candidatus Saccharibacteria bacterium]|nr:hypothetical protein [Candidatus Saccharibacteria bacterium]
MDSLQEILGKKDFTPPDEISAVQTYISKRYESSSQVKLQRDVLIVSVPSSSLAATIQLERQLLIKMCGLNKKLVIRSG